MVLATSADTITVSETLRLLDSQFLTFAEGVAQDRYAFWLGSGISFGRVNGLKEIVPRVIEFLRSQIVVGNSACRFKKALDRALALAHLTNDEKARVDLGRPFTQWPDADAIVSRLISNYARFLDIAVDGEVEDYLLWNGVDVVSTFANPAIEPDVEHLCIAILILEGVLSNIASANWDGLVEKGVDTLTMGQPALVVCVSPQDLREPPLKARLIKFHGCAIKAGKDEATFRPYLIGRQSQINGWVARPENEAIIQRLIDLIATKPTLMLGLSAQDANIQSIFAHAEARLAWPWPGDRPSYVFSENVIGVDQQGLLRNVYRSAFTALNRQQIEESSLIRAYAKPLLMALVLHVLCSKMRKLIDIAPGTLNAADRQHLQAGVITVRDRLGATAESDRLAFVKKLATESSRVVMMFREGLAAGTPRPYNPILPIPIQQIPGDVNIPASGLREAAVATGILGAGVADGTWTLELVDAGDPTSGAIRVNSAAGSARMFFAANSYVALRLQYNGHLVDEPDVILVHSLEMVTPLPRSPRSSPGRTGRVGMREVSIAELLNEVGSSTELIQRFRQEVAL